MKAVWNRTSTVWAEAGPLGRWAFVLILVVVLGMCAGCATTTIPVRVPVPVECRVDVPARPAMPTDASKTTDAIDAKVKAALAELETREGYEVKLRAALDVCTAPITP